MDYIKELSNFYQTGTITKLIDCGILAATVIWPLVRSMRANYQLTKQEISDQKKLRMYQFWRICLAVISCFCILSANFMVLPVITRGSGFQNYWPADVVCFLIYCCGIFCLLQLEAAIAFLLDCIICLPVLSIGLKYFHDKSLFAPNGTLFMGLLFIIVAIAICLFWWVTRGNLLAKKYLGCSTILDLDDRTDTPDEDDVQ